MSMLKINRNGRAMPRSLLWDIVVVPKKEVPVVGKVDLELGCLTGRQGMAYAPAESQFPPCISSEVATGPWPSFLGCPALSSLGVCVARVWFCVWEATWRGEWTLAQFNQHDCIFAGHQVLGFQKTGHWCSTLIMEPKSKPLWKIQGDHCT